MKINHILWLASKDVYKNAKANSNGHFCVVVSDVFPKSGDLRGFPIDMDSAD